jgi:Ca2+-binding RTX toxin-like protein
VGAAVVPIVSTYDALLSGYTWNGVSDEAIGRPVFITFSFDTAPVADPAGQFSDAFLASFQPFTAAEQALARDALRMWADVSGIVLFEVPAGQGDIRFGSYDFLLGPEDIEDSAAFAYNPLVFDFPTGAFEDPYGGDIFFDHGAIDLETLLHEIGHALGLKHPFEGATTLDDAFDNTDQTVMSYTAGVAPATGLGPLDLQAIQFLYGTQQADGTNVASWSWDAATTTLTQAGGPAADRIAGVAVADRITGGAGDDYIMARGGSDRVDGEDGNDTIAGGDGADTLTGGAGNDDIDGDGGDDTISGGPGDDVLMGFAGADTIHGDEGDDFIVGGSGSDLLLGGEGDDLFEIGSGADVIDGGPGRDAVVYYAGGSTGTLITYGSMMAGGATLISIEMVLLFGTIGADTIQGGSLDDGLFGSQGADSLLGAAGDDYLYGDTGADTLSGGPGDDTIDGWSGNDWILASDGADLIYGGTGEDTLDFSATLTGLDVTVNAPRNLPFGQVQEMYEIENIIGTAYADLIKGDEGDNRLFGGQGNDTVVGGDGANYLRGDDGADSLVGGNDFDDINGNMGDDTASGGLGNDWVVGGKDRDRLFGDDGDDLVYGNLGDDTCEGGAGDDTLRGGQQDDVLIGGPGNDFLSGDRDNDTLTGGAGADIFHIFGEAGIERVTDFNLAEGDRVMLAPGSQYTMAQVGADTVISLTGGAQMILVGVSMASLTGDWIFGA